MSIVHDVPTEFIREKGGCNIYAPDIGKELLCWGNVNR